jgi:propanediol dehydratase large subunit
LESQSVGFRDAIVNSLDWQRNFGHSLVDRIGTRYHKPWQKKEYAEKVNGRDKVENARMLSIPSLYRSDFLANC